MSRQNPKNSQAQVAEAVATEKKVAEAVAAQAAPETTTPQDISAAELVSGIAPEAPVVQEQKPAESTRVTEAPVIAEIAATNTVASKPVSATTRTIAATGAPAVQKPAPVVPKAVVVETPVVVESDMESDLGRILKDVPAAYQVDIQRMKTYVVDMDPKKPIDPKKGAANQAALYRSIQGVINRQEQYFTPLFTAMLRLIKGNLKSVFHELNRHRFMEEVALSASDRQAMLNLVTLLCLIADPKGRALAVKTIDINKALESGLTAQGVQRVMDYLNV